MKLYKFTKRKFVDSASFRFGTLYDFRREEKYGTEIGDRAEGTSRFHQEVFHYWEEFDPHILLRTQPFGYAYAKGREADGLKRYTLSITSQDLLIFCVSEVFDEGLFSAFNADVCLEISDWPKFAEALVSSLHLPVEKFHVEHCSYLDKDFFAASRGLPSLPYWKEPRYEYQNEHRLCVSVAMDPIHPVTTTSPDALKLCNIIKESLTNRCRQGP